MFDRLRRYLTSAPRAGELLEVGSAGGPMWRSSEGHGALGRAPAGSLVVAMGDVTDSHIRVLSSHGVVGWIHRGNLVGHPAPGLLVLGLRTLLRPASRMALLVGAALLGAEVLGVAPVREVGIPTPVPPRPPEDAAPRH